MPNFQPSLPTRNPDFQAIGAPRPSAACAECRAQARAPTPLSCSFFSPFGKGAAST